VSDDILDKFSRDGGAERVKERAREAIGAAPESGEPDVFSKYDRTPDVVVEKGKPTRITVRPAEPRGDIADMSGFNNRMASSVPVLGPLFDKATAAAGAAIQPLVSEEARGKSFGQRYGENLAMQDEKNRLYGEEHPVASIAADVTGSGMLLGPLSQTALGARMMGMSGNSLGARVYQGAAGMGALEAGNQLLKGSNPTEQGFFGPVPLAVAGGAAGPMIGEGIAAGGNRLLEWLPRKSGELAGVNSTGRNMLTNAVDGETAASIEAAKAKFGPSGVLADVNNATTDLAGALADIPGPHKQIVREAYRERAAGQADRILQSLDQNTVPHTDIANLTRSIEAAKRSGADPLYNQFRTMQVHPTDEIKALVPRLEKAGAFELAEELSGISGKPIDRKFFTTGAQKEFPTAETWDYVKRGLDRRIGQALDATKPDKDLARELLNLKSQMLAEIDKTPAGKVWKQARETFAEHAELTHQIEEGQKTFSRATRKDDLAHELVNLSGPELAARVQGARDAIQQVIENSTRGDTTARNTLLTRANREKLEMLFGDKRAGRLIADLEAEVHGKAKIENVAGGSQTTPKKERTNAILPQPSEMGYVANLNMTRPASFIPEWMKPQTIMEGARGARHADAYNQIAPLLTRKMGDPKFDDLVDALLAERARGDAIRNRLTQVGSAATGAIAAGSPALRNRLLPQPATP
jgi:hypothetical protein